VVQRAMHLHGALGVSNEMPFARMLMAAEVMGNRRRPTEVHKVTVAKQVLRDHKGVDGLWPSGPPATSQRRRRERLAITDGEIGNL
jgi:acyl-CoA dehydrogenase